MKRKNNHEQLPALSLRGLVLFPGTTTHFDVGRPKSVRALETAMKNDGILFAVCQKNPDEDEPGKNVYETGTVIEIKQVMPLPDGTIRVLARGICRASLIGVYDNGDFLTAEIERVRESSTPEPSDGAIVLLAKESYEKYLDARGETGGEIRAMVNAIQDAGTLADVLANSILDKDFARAAKILGILQPADRLVTMISFMRADAENAAYAREIEKEVQKRIDKNNREYWLREQQRVIEEELGDDDDELRTYEKAIASSPMNEEARQRTEKELKKLKRAAPQSPEAAVMENYIECMTELPWGKYTEDDTSISRARKVLDEDHYGLIEVKKRILEYLAVRAVKEDPRSPILCLVGAPGVGKTSIARSVARALKREFCQVSLGGVHDEAEIRGHRRTYVGAMPGRVISAIKQAGVMNPVFLFDEIDKMASDMRGDPASAMLEVLDPEQNTNYRDHYLEAPFDLSKVLFITTANNLEAIPKPLFDRMDVIEVPSYTLEEKVQIAKRHLWKKQLALNGMDAKNLKIGDDTIRALIEGYTAEAGVRTLERTLGRVIRKVTVENLERGEIVPVKLKAKDLEHYLGARKFLDTKLGKGREVGVVNGLAWTAVGGVVMPIEVATLPGSGALELTGSLGDVMKESARIAYSFVRGKLNLSEEERKKTDIHIHVPEGATPKDGPSAGIAMACALYSALTGKPARQDIAMTGEISLRGKAMPIGGTKEKLLGAYRMGIRMVLVPEENMKDLEDIPEEVLEKLTVKPITTAQEAIDLILSED